MKLPAKDNSYWLASTKSLKYPPLAKDIKVDVAIVGGGIAGLTAAYLLKQEGLKVAVVEQKRSVVVLPGIQPAKSPPSTICVITSSKKITG